MPRIPTVEYENASAEAKKEYENQLRQHGRITNMKKTLLNHVPSFKVLMEWYPLRDMVAEVVGDFGVNVFAHAISSQNNCMICSTFFRRILIDAGYNPDNLVLNERDTLLAEYGVFCVNGGHEPSDRLFARMKMYFTDSEIVLLTTFAGMMIATNLINNALDVEIDEYLVSYAKRK